ncbi:hypothetical protein J6590_038484, partial [Homalodisca vitripennis]
LHSSEGEDGFIINPHREIELQRRASNLISLEQSTSVRPPSGNSSMCHKRDS